MHHPELVLPLDQARFQREDAIRFEWRLAATDGIPVGRLQLYIGRNRARPSDDPGAFVKRWLLDPRQPETWWIATADLIGLASGAAYYCQIAQDPGLLLSNVRTIHIEGEPGAVHPSPQTALRFSIDIPFWILQGKPVRITVSLHNAANSPIRLTFPRNRHFDVSIYRLRLIGQDEYLWPLPVIDGPGGEVDPVEIAAGETRREIVTWPGTDLHGRAVGPGEYIARVRCNARELHKEDREGFVITKAGG
ncbi:MAG: hypothetical protein HYY30_02285 [Chloroflexi bacterium]|nr:hypothetical protein [Chloroflexota bacterium]